MQISHNKTKRKRKESETQWILTSFMLSQVLFVGCLMSQQHASVSQGRICSDNFTCCHTEIEAADQTFYLNQSQYTDTGPTSPSADPVTPGAWQGSHWSANFQVTGMTRPWKKSQRKRDSNPGSSSLEADALPLGQRGSCCHRAVQSWYYTGLLYQGPCCRQNKSLASWTFAQYSTSSRPLVLLNVSSKGCALCCKLCIMLCWVLPVYN